MNAQQRDALRAVVGACMMGICTFAATVWGIDAINAQRRIDERRAYSEGVRSVTVAVISPEDGEAVPAADVHQSADRGRDSGGGDGDGRR